MQELQSQYNLYVFPQKNDENSNFCLTFFVCLVIGLLPVHTAHANMCRLHTEIDRYIHTNTPFDGKRRL